MGQRSKEQHLAAALALLDERGPATTAFELFEMTALAEAVGLHRSTMYRYWNTSSDLHDDLARWLVVEHQGWQRQILAQDPAQPARASLASALDGITAEFAIAIRGAACGFRFDVAGPEIAAWERAWLDALGRWVAAHLQAHDRRPAAGTGAFDIGLALASVVEGALLIGALHGGALLEGWRPEQTDRIVDVADRLLTGMSREGSDPRARPWAGAPELPARRRLERRQAGRLHPDRRSAEPRAPRRGDHARAAAPHRLPDPERAGGDLHPPPVRHLADRGGLQR